MAPFLLPAIYNENLEEVWKVSNEQGVLVV